MDATRPRSRSGRSAWAASSCSCSGFSLRRRLMALFGLAGIVADVKVAGLGGFKAMNEPRPSGPAPPDAAP